MPQVHQSCGELLYIDQHILNESKTRQKNLAMVWNHNKKAHDMVPQSWIINYFKMYKDIRQSHKVYRENHGNLESGIDSRRKRIKLRQRFQRNAQSQLLFVIEIMSLRHKLWKCPWCNGYRRRKWTRRHEFKSWTRLIAFHIAPIPLGKVWIQLISLQLWVNIRADWAFQPWWGN